MIKFAFIPLATAIALQPAGALAESDTLSTSASTPTALSKISEAFGHYLSAWVSGHPSNENLKEIFSTDAVVELKMASRPEWTLRIQGLSGIGQLVRDGTQPGDRWTFSAVRYFPTLKENVVFAQYVSEGSIGDQSFKQDSLVVIELDGARIVHIQDLNGTPALVSAVMGSHKVATAHSAGSPGQ